MRRNGRAVALKNSGSDNLDSVSESITRQELKEVAKEIIGVVEGIKKGAIEYDEARIRLTGMKHLIQLLVLERINK